jgi:hypothetical protein
MRYLKTFKVFEERNYKVIPDDIYQGALKELWSEGQFDNIDDLFGFYDYWLTVGDSELPYYDPVEVKERLESLYSGSPCEGEEWFPMFTSDSDTVEVIMNELSRLYADASFRNGDYEMDSLNNKKAKPFISFIEIV